MLVEYKVKGATMTRTSLLPSLALLMVFLAGLSAQGQVLNGTGSYKGAAPGWDRGMQTTMHCGNSPESWGGGWATVAIRNAEGKTIYTVATDEIGIGGKPPGNVVIRSFSSTVSVPASISQEAN